MSSERKGPRFAVVAVGYGKSIVTPCIKRTLSAAVSSIARDVHRATAQHHRDVGPEHAARMLPANPIARVIFVPAGEADDYDGTVCAQVDAGWGCK